MLFKMVRFITAFIVGTLCYAIGFVVGGLAMDIINSFALFVPPGTNLNTASLVTSAVASNYLGFTIFCKIDKSQTRAIAFSVWLIVIAGIYAALCFITGDIHLLIYPVLSIIFDGTMLAQCVYKVRESDKNQKEELDKLRKELKEKEFEQRFPKVVELKKQKQSILGSIQKIEEENNRIQKNLGDTKREDIERLFMEKRITVEQYNLMIQDYDACETIIKNEEMVKYNAQKALKDIEREIAEFRDLFEKESKGME